MSDLVTVMRKEVAELLGNRRFLWVFAVAVAATGALPALSLAHHPRNVHVGSVAFGELFLVLYALLATAIVVANTAPEMVLHERVGHTLEYLLTTRLPASAIFVGKIVVAAAVGYVAALIALLVQLLIVAVAGGSGFQWLFLTDPAGRVVAFGITAGLSVYVAVVGSFVALRVGEQRAAYMVTILSVGLLLVPFILGWLKFSTSTESLAHVAVGLGILSLLLARLGVRFFRREMLVLYLQE